MGAAIVAWCGLLAGAGLDLRVALGALSRAAAGDSRGAMTRGSRRGDAGGDATFLAYVLDQLGGVTDIESRAMFGGHGLYRISTFFAIVHGGRLYFRTSEATRPKYEAHGMQRFRPSARQTLRSYYEVPAEVMEDARELARWARAAAVPGTTPTQRGTRAVRSTTSGESAKPRRRYARLSRRAHE